MTACNKGSFFVDCGHPTAYKQSGNSLVKLRIYMIDTLGI